MRNQSCRRRTGIVGAVFMALLTCGEAFPLPSDRGIFQTTVFRGRELSYQVIDGMAIHDGDIVLGTAEEAAAAASPRSRPGGFPDIQGQARCGRIGLSTATAVESEYLWPGGVIPYVIDEDVTNSQEVLRAIEQWNSKTVISLVERTTQEDYVRFKFATITTVRCFALTKAGLAASSSSYLHETLRLNALWCTRLVTPSACGMSTNARTAIGT